MGSFALASYRVPCLAQLDHCSFVDRDLGTSCVNSHFALAQDQGVHAFMRGAGMNGFGKGLVTLQLGFSCLLSSARLRLLERRGANAAGRDYRGS